MQSMYKWINISKALTLCVGYSDVETGIGSIYAGTVSRVVDDILCRGAIAVHSDVVGTRNISVVVTGGSIIMKDVIGAASDRG